MVDITESTSREIAREMSEFNLADWTYANPELADEIFEDIDEAIHQILPEEGFHERYDGDQRDFGLAILVQSDELVPANPVTHGDILGDTLSFLASNQTTRESAWGWKDTDPETLSSGKEVPASTKLLGRFVAVAAAKIVHLDNVGSDVLTSHDTQGPEIDRGEVGFAGARRQDKSLIATSGLWEVHDHIVSASYALAAKSIAGEASIPDRMLRKFAIGMILDQEINKVRDILDANEQRAEDLTTEEVSALIGQIDTDYFQHLEPAA